MAGTFAQQFIGTWKLDKSKREGLDAFLEAQGYPKEQAAKALEADVTTTIWEEGDGWKTTIKAGDFSTTLTWKFGEEFELIDMFGNPAKATIVLDGECLSEVCTLDTPKGKSELKIESYIKDNVMERFWEDSNGNKIQDAYNKC